MIWTSTVLPIVAAELQGQLYPVDFQNAYYAIATGIPGVLELDLQGDSKAFAGKELWMELTLTPELIMTESRYKRGDVVKSPKAEILKTSDGVYRFKLTPRMLKSIRKDGYSWHNSQQLVLFVSPQGRPGKYPAAYKVYSTEKDYLSGNFTIEILSPLSPGRKIPEHFKLHGGNTTIINFDKETVDRFYSYIESLKKKPGLFHLVSSKEKEAFESKYTPTLTVFLGDSIPRLHCGWRRKPEITSKIEFSKHGNSHGNLIPEVQYVIDDPEGLIWDKLVPDYIRAQSDVIGQPFKEIFLNIEPGPIYSPFGMSLKNRTEFAKYAGLATPPPTEQIKATYATQWFKFRLHQNNLLAKRFVNCVHKYFPDSKAIICTAVLYPHVRSACAVDPKALDDYCDGFANMFYQPTEDMDTRLRDNSKPTLEKPQYVMLDPAERIEQFFRLYTPEAIKQHIFAAGAYGYEGVCFWPDMLMDGRYYVRIAEAFDIMARVENIYRGERREDQLQYKLVNTAEQVFETDGKKVAVSFPEDLAGKVKVHLNKKDHEYVLTALNHSPDTRVILHARIKDYKTVVGATLVDLSSRILLKDANPQKGFMFEVKPCDSAVIKISNNNEIPANIVLQETLAAQADADRRKYAVLMAAASFTNVDGRIEWGVSPVIMRKAIRMQGNGGYVFVDPELAIVNAWNPNTGEKLDGKGGFGDIVLSDKEQSMPLKYELKSYSCKNAVPVLEFETRIPDFKTESPIRNPLLGLTVRRVIVLETGKELMIKTIFKNNSPFKKDMELDLRFRNFLNTQKFSMVNADAVLPELSGIGAVRQGFTPPAFVHHKYPWSGDMISCYSESENFTDKIMFYQSSHIGAVYFWHSPLVRTIEPILRPFILKYGDSVEIDQHIKFERIYK